jgi:hypothetical protein
MNTEFRKSSFSDNNAKECVEVGGTLAVVRDSKNPNAILTVDLRPLLASLKLDH